MSQTPAVIVCADDFGLSAGISDTIAGLIEAGAINAASWMTQTPAWPAGAERLRAHAAARPEVSLGLHLDLPTPWMSAEAALAAFQAQWRAFEAGIGRPPDFVDGHRHVHLFPGPRRALLTLLAGRPARPWLRQSRTSSARFNLKRAALDPLSWSFAQVAAAGGHALNPGFGGLRRFDPAEDVVGLWRRDLRAMPRGGLLMTHPGPADPSDPSAACRAQEAGLLAAGAALAALDDLGLALAGTRTRWAAG